MTTFTVIEIPNEIELAFNRLAVEEGFLGFLYDDANDLPVKAPIGNATIGFGENVQAGWTREFALKVLRLRVQERADALAPYPWYRKCNAARRSVFIDIAFNDGIAGFVKGFPKLEAAVMIDDWVTAKAECHVKNVKLKKRYDALGQILLTGLIAG